MKTNSLPSSQPSFSSSEFIFAICHELKTPLNAIVGFSEVLKEDVSNPNLIKDCAEYAREINAAAMDLNELIHDLLDVGQASSGNFSVDLSQEIDVRDAIKKSVRINYDYALKRNILIDVCISDEIRPINLDAKRMKQILTNLISNAIKYSPTHSEIKILANNVDAAFSESAVSAMEIAVHDCGFGMTKEQIEIAFSKYGTIQNPNSKNVESFGFGLPIVKHLVEAQGGKIEVKSEVNKGSVITIIFPY